MVGRPLLRADEAITQQKIKVCRRRHVLSGPSYPPAGRTFHCQIVVCQASLAACRTSWLVWSVQNNANLCR